MTRAREKKHRKVASSTDTGPKAAGEEAKGRMTEQPPQTAQSFSRAPSIYLFSSFFKSIDSQRHLAREGGGAGTPCDELSTSEFDWIIPRNNQAENCVQIPV